MSHRTAVLAVVAWVYLGGVVLQVALAGASLFGDLEWTVHGDLGWGVGTAGLLVMVAALAARLDRVTTILAVALAILSLVQPELAGVRDEAPFVAALHPLNSLVLAWLAWTIAWRATTEVRQERRRSAAQGSPGGGDSPSAPGDVPGDGGRGSLEDGTRPHV